MKNLINLQGKRLLIIASTGGHLTQAVKWAEILDLAKDSMFVTFESAQSRSLLGGRPHYFVPYVAPRDYKSLFMATAKILRSEKDRSYDAILSTGAGLALSCLPISWLKRRSFFYIESVSRFRGPSFTGKLLQAVPGVQRFAQHPGYNSKKWTQVDSLLTTYEAQSNDEAMTSDRPLKIFVSLGTIKPYRFDRLIDGLLPAIAATDEVVWQVGDTMRGDLPGSVQAHVEAADFEHLCTAADVVVTHAGVGTLMGLLDYGKKPLVMARRAALGEHVDDHQLQVTERLHSLGLITSYTETVARQTLLQLANSRIVSSSKRDH